MLMHLIILALELLVASLDPYQIVSEDRNYDIDSNGIAYLSIDPYLAKYRMKFFWKV